MSKAFQNKVRRCLEAAGLVPDVMDSYGQLVTFKVEMANTVQSARRYAWQIFEALPGSDIFDYFEATGLDGKEYAVVRFRPGEWPKRPQKVVKAVKSEPVVVKPLLAQGQGSYLDNRLHPQVGHIAWTTVTKKNSNQLKQARCQIMAVKVKQVEIKITKTGRQLTVPPNNLFDHVPKPTNNVWL